MTSALIDSIDSDALRERAETLRHGMKCTVSLPPANEACFNMDVVERRNYHGSIVFEDGKAWLARYRLPNHNAPPVEERNFDRRSEFATYRFPKRIKHRGKGIIDLELAIITAKIAAFQSPLLLYDLGELYHEGLSTPSEDEKHLAKILQEETKSDELSALVVQKQHFGVDQVVETNAEDGENLTRDMWYRNALFFDIS
ncbi:Protein kinase-like (PK-like) [Ceratocystis lukuohia]|uniref:Protein kinase-like (PK-like) n=1 Tax=Ceratocystis lukuohia TaxID=2019550 RepID=A0ABR4MM26_9PEZI